MNVTPFKNANSEPDHDTVEKLEHALALAKAGELRSVALVGSLIGHETYTAYSSDDLIEVMGSIAYLSHVIGEKLHEDAVPS